MTDAPHERRSRPASPFLILVVGLLVTAVAVEWMRFQWGWAAALPPAVAGTVWSLARSAGAFRRRRHWRRRVARGEAAAAPPAHAEAAEPWAVQARRVPDAQDPEADPAPDTGVEDPTPTPAAPRSPVVSRREGDDTLTRR